MRHEWKLIAIVSAMAFILGAPLGIYLMSFRSEGLLGDILFYVGAVILLPGVLLYKPLGLSMAAFVLVCSPLLYLWFALWVWVARRVYLRRAKAPR